jgi:hypothetical protein
MRRVIIAISAVLVIATAFFLGLATGRGKRSTLQNHRAILKAPVVALKIATEDSASYTDIKRLFFDLKTTFITHSNYFPESDHMTFDRLNSIFPHLERSWDLVRAYPSSCFSRTNTPSFQLLSLAEQRTAIESLRKNYTVAPHDSYDERAAAQLFTDRINNILATWLADLPPPQP